MISLAQTVNNCGVYTITNSVNGKRYVGSSVDLKRRWRCHRKELVKGTHHSRHLQSAWNKYGRDAFVFEPILFCDKAKAVWFEQRAIDALHPEYNASPTAGSCLGVKLPPFTAEHRRKISEAHKGKKKGPMPEALKKKLTKLNKERVWTEEMRESMRRRHKGIPLSMEHRRKLSVSHTGKRYGRRPSAWRKNIGKALGHLTEDQVRSAREKLKVGARQCDLAREFGVCSGIISLLASGKSYRWVA